MTDTAKSQTAAHREVTRAKALLLAADGLASTAVAYEVGVSPSSVVAWRSRFAEEGLAKLGRVRPGRGRKPQIPAEKIDEIVRLTQESKPEGETHWSCRSMAKAAGAPHARWIAYFMRAGRCKHSRRHEGDFGNAKHRRFAPARRHGVRLTRPTNSSLQVIR